MRIKKVDVVSICLLHFGLDRAVRDKVVEKHRWQDRTLKDPGSNDMRRQGTIVETGRSSATDVGREPTHIVGMKTAIGNALDGERVVDGIEGLLMFKATMGDRQARFSSMKPMVAWVTMGSKAVMVEWNRAYLCWDRSLGRVADTAGSRRRSRIFTTGLRREIGL
jgi:hypothetical protein